MGRLGPYLAAGKHTQRLQINGTTVSQPSLNQTSQLNGPFPRSSWLKTRSCPLAELDIEAQAALTLPVSSRIPAGFMKEIGDAVQTAVHAPAKLSQAAKTGLMEQSSRSPV